MNLNRETPKLSATQVQNSPKAIIIKQEIDEGMDVKKKKEAFTYMSLL